MPESDRWIKEQGGAFLFKLSDENNGISSMLVITRKSGEELIISDRIEVKIIGITKGRVRLGITAPLNMAVYRKELYTEIVEKNRSAVRTKRQDVGKVIKEILGKEAEDVECRT